MNIEIEGIPTRSCNICGLIQADDILFGLMICGSNDCQINGCHDRENVLEQFPEAKYNESIYSEFLNNKGRPSLSDFLLNDVIDCSSEPMISISEIIDG